MRQAASDFKQDLNAQAGNSAGLPTGNDGLDMTAVSDGGMRASKYTLLVTVGGTGSAVVSVYGKGRSAVWGAAGDNAGAVNGGVALAAGNSYYFEVENLGIFLRCKTYVSGSTGSPTISTFLAPIYERGD
jgi:hypothetical protein